MMWEVDRMIKINSEVDFKKKFGKDPQKEYIKGLDKIQEMYESSANIFEFTEKLLKYVGIEEPNEEQYKNMFIVAGTIHGLIMAISMDFRGSEEMMYG